jgi:hypothetical protein
MLFDRISIGLFEFALLPSLTTYLPEKHSGLNVGHICPFGCRQIAD